MRPVNPPLKSCIGRSLRRADSEAEPSEPSTPRREVIFREMTDRYQRETDRLFGKLLVAQWLFAVVLALVISPWSYTGEARELHVHVKVALGFGALMNALPLTLIWLRPGWWGTRHAIAVVQMMWSAMLIMISGGRIETHFHIFASLAFLAIYRDWKILLTATLVVSIDHLARGLWWPESVYGVANPEWWRFLEHASWIACEDAVLIYACIRGVKDVQRAATREARLERTNTIVERKVADRTVALQLAVERYRELVEGSAAIPFELEVRTLRIHYIAPQAARLFDCSPNELTDNLFASSLHPDDEPLVRSAMQAFARGEPKHDLIEFRMTTSAGRHLHARTMVSSCLGGRIRGIILDVTRQKKLESDLQQAQKLESVGRLAAGVAHEINTPVQFVNDSVQFVRDSMTDLMGIVQKQQAVVAEVLAANPSAHVARAASDAVATADLPYLSEEIPRALERAVHGLDRVAVIVRSMKVFAHPGGELAEVDLNTAIASTLTVARHEYRYVADVETSFGDVPRIVGYAGELNQVILNVLINAAHAIGDRVNGSSERGLITVSTARDGDAVLVSISDTGGGIPDHVRERVFDPFFTTKQVGRGTGQGLAIARAVIVEKHHGTLTFESKVGVGTTFHIRIPIDSRVSQTEHAA